MIQRSPQWFAARSGKITASRFGDVLAAPTTKRYQYYLTELVSELSGAPAMEDDKPWFQHGRDLEPIALSRYEFEMSLTGQDLDVDKMGFVLHPEHKFIGCSPDGEIGLLKGLEIKSSISHKAYLKMAKRGLPSNHVPQVQGQLWICGYNSIDFVLFFHDPDGRLEDEITITNVLPDLEYHKKLETKCLEFWEKAQEQVHMYEWEPA